MKRLSGLCIITPDVERIRDFYSRVLDVTFDGDAAYASYTSQGIVLSLYPEDGMEGMAPGSMQGAGRGAYTLEFEVDDVDAEYNRLLGMGISIVKPPTTQPWGVRSVWFRDPDGNIVNFLKMMREQPGTEGSN